MSTVPRFAPTALLLLATLAPAARAQPAPLEGLDQLVTTAIREFEHPGLAIAVVKDDSVIYAKGFGVRALGNPAPVDAHTLFAIGSSSKAFTGLAMAMLVDEGKVRWDEPIATYLPGFQLYDPYVTRELTVRDALTHRSGLARTDLVWISGQFDSDELLRRLRFVKPASSFRSQFGYQNLMYLAAGTVVARVSGLGSWQSFVEQRIFGPLGMKESNTSVRALAELSDVAQPHARIDDTIRVVHYRNADRIAPAGAINSNVLDMARWLRFQLADGKVDGKRLLGEKALEETRTPQFTLPMGGGPNASRDGHFNSYGFGWFLRDYRGHFVIHHGGNIDGMTALVAFMPDDQVGVVALTNMNGSPLPSALVYSVFDRYIGGQPRDHLADVRKARERSLARAKTAAAEAEAKRVKGTKPSLELARYAGTYADSANGVMRVALENGTLVVHYGPEFTGDLEHWNYDTFRVHWRHSALFQQGFVTFELDRAGKVAVVDAGPFGEFSAGR